ncbi:MAG TPA: hypothetical protein PLH94_12860 [Fimbriimonadaceae bacterium]|nr:hypothetical protein [Fimbriimonadaceae bacterium]
MNSLSKFVAVVAVFSAGMAISSAQVRPLHRVSKGEEAVPLRIAPIGPGLQLRGPWRDYVENPSIQVPVWQVSYDSYEGDAGGVPTDTIYGPSLGLGAERWFLGDFYHNPFSADDCVLAPGTGGKVAERVQLGWFWNPISPERMLIAVYVADNFGATDAGPSFGFEYSGVLIDYGVVAASTAYKRSDVKLKGLAGDPQVVAREGVLPLPWDGNGAIVMQILTLDAFNNLVPASTAQPMLWGTRWASNPDYPGTNPSRSDRYKWDDDNPTDLIHQTGATGERYDYDYGIGSPPRILNNMVALFVDQNAEYIGGTIDFQDISPTTTRPIKTATLEIRQSGNIVDLYTVGISASGQFQVPAPSTPGVYEISCVDSTFLRRTVGPVTTTGAPGVRSVGPMTMLNGNITGDDPGTIDSDDFDLLVAAFGSNPGSGNWNISADLDRSDLVDSDDFDILVKNFGFSGNP